MYESLAKSLVNTDVSSDPVNEQLKRIDQISSAKDLAFVVEDTGVLLQESKDGLGRIKGIIAGLKAFSHVDRDESASIDINEVLENALTLVWNQLKYNCEIERDLGELPPVIGNAGEIGQVFTNLLINASHAIDDQGKIKLKTSCEDGEVIAQISDTGCGIPEENLNNIFNPFFTTKPVGKGTGLGLSISHGIATKYGGTLSVESTVGVGATFKLRLPVESRPLAKAS